MSVALQTPSIPKQDENGLLVDPAEWDETVAIELAVIFNVGELTNDHWLVIHALRNYYEKFGVAPAMSNVCYNYDQDKYWVHSLFGSCLNAWRVAGLPDPGEEAKSYLDDM